MQTPALISRLSIVWLDTRSLRNDAFQFRDRLIVIIEDLLCSFSCSEDSTIRIWNLRPEASGVPIVLREDEQPRFLSLSKDGRFIVSGNDNAIELWQLKVDELMRLARVIAGRNLSHAEWRELFPGKPYVKTFKELAGSTDEEEPPANAAPKAKASSNQADPSPH